MVHLRSPGALRAEGPCLYRTAAPNALQSPLTTVLVRLTLSMTLPTWQGVLPPLRLLALTYRQVLQLGLKLLQHALILRNKSLALPFPTLIEKSKLRLRGAHRRKLNIMRPGPLALAPIR